jgi:hypothetical protein
MLFDLLINAYSAIFSGIIFDSKEGYNRFVLFDTFVKRFLLKSITAIGLLLLIPAFASGQVDSLKQVADTSSGRVYLLQKVERNGETLPEVEIKEVTIVSPGKNNAKKLQSQYRKYDRLVLNLKIVYPYAVIVRSKLMQVNGELTGLKSDKDRRRYLKDVEKEVFSEYEDEISHFTVTQGRLLIKLIDRETQNTSYELIKLYRGGFNAAFWQGIARIFGTNLKETYDPYGTDAVMEYIIEDIEAGRI